MNILLLTAITSPTSLSGMHDYRFVEWYGFNRTSAKANWDNVWGTELYNHTHPTKFFNDENENLAEDKDMADVVQEMMKMLQDG